MDLLRDWLFKVSLSEEVHIASLLYVFCTDLHLHKLNKDHLNHDTYTDIITFPETYDPINAEIYISLDRVIENAEIHSNGNVKHELCGVILHGLLHMCNYNDHSDAEKMEMRQREDFYLARYRH